MIDGPAVLGVADAGTGRIPEDDAHRLIDRFVELGGHWLDTAHCYAFWRDDALGRPDQIAGAAARRHPGLKIMAKGAHVGMDGYPRPDHFLTAEIAERDLDESLERMKLSSVALWLFHRDDPRVPVEEIVHIGAGFVLDGRAGAWGVSNWSATRVQEAQSAAGELGLPRLSVVENQWSLARPSWTMDGAPGEVRYVDTHEAPLLAEAGVEVVAYSPTACGYFAGRDDGPFRSEENARLRDALGSGERTGTQRALDWLRAQPVPTIPILGTASLDHLEEGMSLG